MRVQVQSLASISGLRNWHCHELWCRLQMCLGSHIALAVVSAGGYSSDLTPSLGSSICHRCSPKRTKKRRVRIVSSKWSLPAHPCGYQGPWQMPPTKTEGMEHCTWKYEANFRYHLDSKERTSECPKITRICPRTPSSHIPERP